MTFYGLVFLVTSLAINFLYFSIVKFKEKSSKVHNRLYADKKSLNKPCYNYSCPIFSVSPILTPIACVLTSAMWIIPK